MTDSLILRANELLRETLDLMKARRDERPVRTSAIQPRPRHEAEILGMYAHASSLYEAIAILLRRGHADEAFSLGRALFSESLRLGELANADQKGRIGLVATWVDKSLVAIMKIQADIEKRRTGEPDPAFIDRLRDLRKQMRDYAARHSARPKAFPTEKDMAARQDRGDELGDYALSHEFVHGGFSAYMQRARFFDKGPDRVVVLSVRTDKPNAIAAVAAFTTKSAVLAHREAGVVLGWSDDGSVTKLLAQAQSLGEASQVAS